MGKMMLKKHRNYGQIVSKPIQVIKIYKKNVKKVFCEFEVPDRKHFDNLLDELNKNDEMRYVKFGPVIFDKQDFDYATYEEIEQR